jgi:hypothetical protein
MLSLALYLYFPMLLFDVLPYLCIYTFDWIVFFFASKTVGTVTVDATRQSRVFAFRSASFI